MNGNRYVDEIVLKYQPATGPGTPVYEVGQRLRGMIQRWYSERLERVHNSGSFAKGTSIRGGVDLDLFISLKPGTGKSLRAIYEGLYRYADGEGFNPRRQNVSIGVEVDTGRLTSFLLASTKGATSTACTAADRRRGRKQMSRGTFLWYEGPASPGLSAPPRYGAPTEVFAFLPSISSLQC